MGAASMRWQPVRYQGSKRVTASSQVRLGIICAITAAFAFSVNDVGIKFISGDYPLHEIVFFRAVISLIISLAVLVPLDGGYRQLKTSRLKLHLLRGLLVVLANSFFFLGLAVIPLSEATALFFIAPIVITMFSVIFLGETVGRFRWSATAIGLVGAIIMLRPTSAGFQPLAILPIMAAVCYAGIHMLARHMGDTERASTLSVYIQGVFLVVCIGMGILFGDGRHAPGDGGALDFLLRAWVIPPREDIPLLLLIGLSSAVGGFCVSQAYRVSEAAVIAPFEYVALVMSIIWGVTIFGTLPDMIAWTGIGLILASGLIVFWREAMLNRRRTSNAYRQR